MKSKKRENKKAQITAFVILGLIIVLSSVLGYYYRNQIINSLKEKGLLETVVLPSEVREIEELVNLCIDDIAKSGLDIIGQQGGYIVLPKQGVITPVNPFSNALEIFTGSNLKVAYWLYQDANSLFESLLPQRQVMEQELENYINANLDNCVDFSNFDFGIISGGVKSDVKLLNNEVNIDVEYPLEINLKGKNFKLINFQQNVKSSLGELYESAIKIINKENNEFFLEEKTLDFINVYEEIPSTEVDFECTPKRWKKDEVIGNLKQILDVNINSYRVKDTKDSDVDDKYRILNLLEDAKDINVNFEYSPNWPLLIDITPGDNILQGDSFNKGVIGRSLTQFFCLNSYHFIYDLRYPVLVSLSKDDSTFQFATQVIIENNQPRENKIEIDQSYDTNPIICENPLTKIKVYALGIKPDNSLGQIKDAKISYKCSNTICDIGETNNLNGEVFLENKFPQCINGQLIVEKEGFDTAEVELSTNQESVVSVIMEPVYEKTFEVKITENNIDRILFENEQIIINFRNEQSNYYETIAYPDNNKVKLIDGSYDIDANIIFNSKNPIRINGKELETCIDAPREGVLGIIGLTEKKCEKTTIEGIDITQVFTGGAKFSWNVNRVDLADANNIIFYLNGFGIPTNVDELNNVLTRIETTSVKEPEFVK
ncbi:hypothetical protein HYX17_03500 [Candidatus Woesearchaeota archaeon]|nr:hypothetical protein [Candidatus Woesearchaeota archaeon]